MIMGPSIADALMCYFYLNNVPEYVARLAAQVKPSS